MPQIPNEKRILLLLVFAAFLATQLPNVLVLGKNADGVEYAAVARNMAEGYGTLYKPYLSDHQWPVHYEQPPLFYGIQSLFFRIFGDCDYMEGIYGVLVGLVVLGLVALLWREVRRDRGDPEVGAWCPILLLLTLSQFVYNIQSNRLLTTYMVFALFALAVPGIAWITFRVDFRRTVVMTVLVTATFAALFGGLLWLSEDARALWTDLNEKQVLDSVRGNREANRPALYNVGQFGQQMLGPLGALLIAALVTRTGIRRFRFSRTTAFFLLVALAGSLPLFFLPRQKIRYMLHAFPFFLMALATVMEVCALRTQAFIAERRGLRLGFCGLSAFLVLAGAVTMVVREGEVTKAHDFYRDVYLQNLPIPRRATVHIKPGSVMWKWHLWQYAPRHMAVNLKRVKPDAPWPEDCEFLLIEKDSGVEIPPGFRRINAESSRVFQVYGRAIP